MFTLKQYRQLGGIVTQLSRMWEWISQICLDLMLIIRGVSP